MAPERMYTIKELADLTGLPYRRLLRAATSGELESFRMSGNGHGPMHTTESAYDRWLERCKTKVVVRGRMRPGRQGSADRQLADLAL